MSIPSTKTLDIPSTKLHDIGAIVKTMIGFCTKEDFVKRNPLSLFKEFAIWFILEYNR